MNKELFFQLTKNWYKDGKILGYVISIGHFFKSMLLFAIMHRKRTLVWWIQLSEFEIFQSYSMSANNFRRDDVRVIVYKNRNSEEMFKRVEYEVNRLSGKPNTEIVLRLYHSKREVRNGIEPYMIVYISYIEDTYEIE